MDRRTVRAMTRRSDRLLQAAIKPVRSGCGKAARHPLG